MHKWQLYEAKNKLSDLFERAMHGDVQCITRRGKDAVVMIKMDEYLKLQKPKKNLKNFLLEAPKIDNLEITRSNAKVRGIDL